MSVETVTANNPTDATTSTETPAPPVAAATGETGTTQQTQTVETPAATTTETPASGTTTEETPVVPVVPETYVFTAPEGKAYDPKVLESFSGAAKEAGLTQDAAQKLIDKMAPALDARVADQVKALHQTWFDASSADKEYGGEKLQETMTFAKRALDAFDPTPVGADGKPVPTPFRKLLEETGLANHPEMVRFVYRAGKAISEDTFVGGGARSGAGTNRANVLYDKTPQK